MPDNFKEFEQIKDEVRKELSNEFKSKFDAIFRGQDEINKSVFTLTQMITPMAEAWNNYKGFKKTIVPVAKVIIFIGTTLGALYVVTAEIKKFFMTH